MGYKVIGYACDISTSCFESAQMPAPVQNERERLRTATEFQYSTLIKGNLATSPPLHYIFVIYYVNKYTLLK